MERRIVRNINYFLEWVLRQIGRKAWVSACRSWLGNLTLTEICELKFLSYPGLAVGRLGALRHGSLTVSVARMRC